MPDVAPVVEGQHWPTLTNFPLGELAANLRVCVVIPARDCQDELDRTLASLSEQSYPEALLEVVVVDDASNPPLSIPSIAPERTRILRVQDAEEHGSGRARDRGARSTAADVVLFLDADMVADRWHVEAHARWHHVIPHAVVLGHKWFVDFDGIPPADVAHAVAGDDLDRLLEGRQRQRHSWQEKLIKKNRSLTRDFDETFVAVVGADISIRREFYEHFGGFASFNLRGIVDTEFGYRAFTAGGLIIPDREALAYHQGARTFTSNGQQVKRERSGLAANYLPLPMFRPNNTGRRWAVSRVHAIVPTDGKNPEEVLLTVDALLASSLTDLRVEIAGDAPRWLRDYYAHDHRVIVQDEASTSGFPAPVTLVTSPGIQVGRKTLAEAVKRVSKGIALHAEIAPGLQFTIRTTRSLERAAFSCAPLSLPDPERVSAEEFGLKRTVSHVNPQGMLTLGPPPPPDSPPGKKKLGVAVRARRKAHRIARRAGRRVRRLLRD